MKPSPREDRDFTPQGKVACDYAASVSTHPLGSDSFDEILRTTRSVRRRLDFDRPIEPEVLEACIEIATQAPTGRNAENWRFLIVTDPDKKLAIAELYRRALADLVTSRRLEAKATQQALADRLHEMPALILVCSEGRPPEQVAGQVGFYGSILPAAWSLMLALRARGIGATWTSLLSIFEAEVATVLNIPDDVTQTILLPVGYTRDAVLRPADRKPPHEVTYWNAWGQARES